MNKTRLVNLSCMILVGFSAVVLTSCASRDQNRPAGSAVVGTLTVMKGAAAVTTGGKRLVITELQTAEIREGDVVATEAGAEAAVSTGVQVHVLGPGSVLRFDAALRGVGGTAQRVSLLKGLATFLLQTGQGTRRFQAETGTLVAAVRGTIFRLKADETSNQLLVLRGEVEYWTREGPGGTVSPIREVPAHDRRAAKAGDQVTATGKDAKVESVSEDVLSQAKAALFLTKEKLKIDIAQF